MKSKLLNSENGRRTFAIIFDTGDEVLEGMKRFAKENGLEGAEFTAIGAFERVTLGYWDWEKKDYEENRLDEQVEVASLVGNVALAPDGGRKVHIHLVVGRRDGTAWAGHLLEGRVRPTLEVVLTESPEHLQRTHDDATGLALIDADA